MSNPGLTDTEHQAVLFSESMTGEQVEFVCRAIHTEQGKSK
jgi:hypothetical protein